MKRIILAALASLGLVLFGATTATATEAPFAPFDTAAGGVQTTSTVSAVAADTVTLIQDGRATATAGTSAETSNLGVEVQAGDVITVDYDLTGGADFAAGAVRLFIYYSPDADTWNTAPDQVAIADAASGTLSITADGGTIGTAGVVYDTSNPSEGTATFTNLTVAGESVPFLPVADEDPKDEDPVDEDPKDEDPKGDDDEEPAPKDEQPKEEPKDDDSDDDTTPVASKDGELPDTGASTVFGAVGAAALLVLGGTFLFIAHLRRRPTH